MYKFLDDPVWSRTPTQILILVENINAKTFVRRKITNFETMVTPTTLKVNRKRDTVLQWVEWTDRLCIGKAHDKLVSY